MERIASFSIDHLILKPGLYVSRKDTRDGVTVTTFDIRLTAPNREPVVDMPALHTIEHLGATYLRNGRRRDEIVYFGPMGCRTGSYLLMFGDLSPEDIYEGKDFSRFRIMYRKAIKYGETIRCFYGETENAYVVTLKDESGDVRAIMELEKE